MNPQNIQDYVVNKVIEKLDEKDKEIEKLRYENNKLNTILKNYFCWTCYNIKGPIFECEKCKKRGCGNDICTRFWLIGNFYSVIYCSDCRKLNK